MKMMENTFVMNAEIPTKTIKVFLKNGLTAEGQVEEWTDHKIILRAPNTQDQLIIYNINENVVMIRVFNEPLPIAKVVEQPTLDIREDSDRLRSDDSLKYKSLAELRKLQLAEHRAKIKAHLGRAFVPTNQVKTYEYPNFQKPSFNNRPK